MFKRDDKRLAILRYVKTLLKETQPVIKGFDAANRVIYGKGDSKSEARLE
jgi:hypothetical protein